MINMLQDQQMQEMYNMVRENNHLLRTMHRVAVVGRIVKAVFYVVFIIVPLWYSLQYLGPLMQPFLNMTTQAQGKSAEAQVQIGKVQDLLKQFQELIPGASGEMKK